MTNGPNTTPTADQPSERQPAARFLAFLAAFFAVWTIRATQFDSIDDAFPSTISRAAFSTALKALLWIVPGAIFVRRVSHGSPAAYLGLTAQPSVRVWRHCLAAIALFLAIVTTVELTLGPKSLSLTPLWELPPALWLLQLGLSPLIEELLFRGLILKELLRFARPSVAIVADSLLFVGIHLPYWLSHQPVDSELATNSFGVFVFSLLAGYLGLKSSSIWPPTLAHIANNTLALILVNPVN
ncbi:MAG: CPBP family intramembrane glutamic endopeptidase [Planctomycetaceae bacterium]